MICYNRFDIDPEWEELLTLLREAAATFADAVEPRFLWPLSGLGNLQIEWLTAPEGKALWPIVTNRLESEDITRNIRLNWWMDHLAFRHIRIVAEEIRDSYWYPGAARIDDPALLMVYPEAGCIVEREDAAPVVLVVCVCGAVGTPDEIAWMGTECGPCHDRREAGELPQRPWDAQVRHRVYRDLPGGRNWEQCFPRIILPDGTLRIDDGEQQFTWNIRTGELREESAPEVLARSSDGNWLALRIADRRVRIESVRDASNGMTVQTGGTTDQARLSSQGRYLAVVHGMGEQRTLEVWDRLSPDAAVLTRTIGAARWTFSSDEDAVYLAERMDRILVRPLGKRGSWKRLPTGQRKLPDVYHEIKLLEAVGSGDALVAVYNGRIEVFARTGGELLAERESTEIAGWDSAPFPIMNRQALAAVDVHSGTVSLIGLPDLKGLCRLRLLGLGRRIRGIASDDWLALSDEVGIRLLPWAPVLGWYRREVLRS